MGGFAHNQVMALADKVVEAVKSGAIKRFVVMAGCDGRYKTRSYFTEVAQNLPRDTVILTAGCAKYRYNKLFLDDIGGIPRILDAGIRMLAKRKLDLLPSKISDPKAMQRIFASTEKGA